MALVLALKSIPPKSNPIEHEPLPGAPQLWCILMCHSFHTLRRRCQRFFDVSLLVGERGLGSRQKLDAGNLGGVHVVTPIHKHLMSLSGYRWVGEIEGPRVGAWNYWGETTESKVACTAQSLRRIQERAKNRYSSMASRSRGGSFDSSSHHINQSAFSSSVIMHSLYSYYQYPCIIRFSQSLQSLSQPSVSSFTFSLSLFLSVLVVYCVLSLVMFCSPESFTIQSDEKPLEYLPSSMDSFCFHKSMIHYSKNHIPLGPLPHHILPPTTHHNLACTPLPPHTPTPTLNCTFPIKWTQTPNNPPQSIPSHQTPSIPNLFSFLVPPGIPLVLPSPFLIHQGQNTFSPLLGSGDLTQCGNNYNQSHQTCMDCYNTTVGVGHIRLWCKPKHQTLNFQPILINQSCLLENDLTVVRKKNSKMEKALESKARGKSYNGPTSTGIISSITQQIQKTHHLITQLNILKAG
ncbi:hypothetical protein VP01_147g3 [Puccinia sorghi]|uniref:Uncharacterized protein n=1 Tax=Puccinia sorghi TaxID=27349 RepID=A0A0L6VJI1_9BASI|nr:hypothetical protein VP01_147g3 [Puccinia sorghi]